MANSDVAMNEYRIWLTADRHARAYQVLSNEQSQRIARTLVLPNAETAAICLDCHADNVAQERLAIFDGGAAELLAVEVEEVEGEIG